MKTISLSHLKILLRIALLAAIVVIAIPIIFLFKLTGSMHKPIAPPDKFFAVPVEDLTVLSSDGVQLSGWYLAGNNNKIAAVLCHGIEANRWQMVDQARFLNRAGHPVILFDFRNHGISGGKNTSYGWFERLDAMAMVDEMRRRSPGSKVVLWGLSMGAATSLLAAPEILELAGVIAESPFDTMENTFYHHNELYFHMPDWPSIPIILALMGAVGDYDADEVSPIAAVARSGRVPMLFVAGEEDKRMLPEMVRKIAKAHPGRHSFYIGKGSHAIIFQASGSDYKKEVLSFLDGLKID